MGSGFWVLGKNELRSFDTIEATKVVLRNIKLYVNKEEGFLVSNRKGGVSLLSETCCDDIYEYKWSEFIHVGVTGKIYAIKDSAIYKQLEHQIEVEKFINDDDPFEKIDPLNKQVVNLFLVADEKVFIKSDITDVDGKYCFDIEPGKE